ncbi:MAG: hypothetical protein QXV05_05205, partial [Candidatus Korarchaeum sp.]
GYAVFIGVEENGYFEELPEPFVELIDKIRVSYSSTFTPDWYGESVILIKKPFHYRVSNIFPYTSSKGSLGIH